MTLKIYREIKPDLLVRSSLALGMFDGVHLGHQQVISEAVNKGNFFEAVPAVLTFSSHPNLITAKTPVKSITSLDDKLAIMEEMGIEAALVVDFTREFSQISAYDYIKNILSESLHAVNITVGYNHRFGKQKTGDKNILKTYESVFGYSLSVIQPVLIDGHTVSSSAVRKFISSGDVEIAAKFLGREFSVKGKVVKGKGRGTAMGFPTANLLTERDIIIPHSGVYFGIINIDGKEFHSAVNIGKRPTFGDLKQNLIEAHIFDYKGELYGKELTLTFVKKIRDEIKFDTEQELAKQIKIDCEAVLNLSREKRLHVLDSV